MKRIVTSLILVVCFSALGHCSCIEHIKTFYITYMNNIEHDNFKNKALCHQYLTEELMDKVAEMVEKTNSDPIIRAQDVSADGIATLCVKPLEDNWYIVSYYWNKNDKSSLIQIPIEAHDIDGECKITDIQWVINT